MTTHNVWLTKDQVKELQETGGPVRVNVETGCDECGSSETVEIAIWNNDD